MSKHRLVWINGPFGAGKSSVARALLELRTDAFLIDPEILGALLRHTNSTAAGDYQDLPAWRELVIASVEILHRNGSPLVIMPMTVLNRTYFDEVVTGVTTSGIRVLHVLLDASPAVLESRIAGDANDPGAAAWRRQKLSAYADAKQWLVPAADLQLATDGLTVAEAAAAIDRLLG